MDFVSHALYGGVFFGRQNRKMFWWAFFFGMMPDILVFGPLFIQRFFNLILGNAKGGFFGRPESLSIPTYVYQGYNITHSLVIFAVVFGLVWLIRKKVPWVILGWPLHILMDLFTHSTKFFPTPIFWPISNFHINGIPWSEPIIYIPNVILLIILYTYFFVIRPRQYKNRIKEIN
jgi:membrane-bound metal-dependent hydrolase YbcI (DUF457 family)